MAEDISFNGQILSGHTRVGQWLVDGLEGWWEPPPTKDEATPRVNGDGGVVGVTYYESRPVTVDGTISASSRDYVLEGITALNRAAVPSGGKLMIRDGKLPLWLNARVLGVDYTWLTQCNVRYQLRLLADDPYKYGDTQSFSTSAGSSVAVSHRGNVPAWPVVTITGSMPGGYSMSLNGRTVKVTQGLSSGKTHTLDMRSGILREDGDRIHGGIDISEYLRINPGKRQTFTASATGSGSGAFSVRVKDTYN